MIGAGRGGAGVILIPSAAFTPGYQDAGGQHLMPVNMRQLSLIWDTVTLAMVSTTQPMPLTDGGNLLNWGKTNT